MERFAWKGYVLEGRLDEYIKRHDAIWSEMTELLNQAGVHNYTIWNIGNELFGYYECESVEKADKIQSESPVVARWNEYMKDLMYMQYNDDGKQNFPVQVFFHP